MRTVIGVMGSGDNDDAGLLGLARDLGAAIAREGWVLLNGGRACGVMDASASGARSEGGLVIGVLPDEDDAGASPYLDVGIRTGMGDARNAINALSSDVVIALRGGAGTLSEVALALKARRPVIALDFDLGSAFERYRDSGALKQASSVAEAIAMVRESITVGADIAGAAARRRG